MSEQSNDPRTGRPWGDHGTHEDAVEYASEQLPSGTRFLFMDAWTHGGAFEEWPEFYAWLSEREQRP